MYLQPIGHLHFSENLDFIDLFLRDNVSSLSRAQAFLWLCYHYLEAPLADSDDDYDDDGPSNPFTENRRGNTPTFVFLSDAEVEQENVDPEEEKDLATKLVAQRAEILRTQGAKEATKASGKTSGAGSVMGDDDEEPVSIPEEAKPKAKRGAVNPRNSATAKEKKAAAAALRRLRLKEAKAKERQQLLAVPVVESDEEYDTPAPQSEHSPIFLIFLSAQCLISRHRARCAEPISLASIPISTAPVVGFFSSLPSHVKHDA